MINKKTEAQYFCGCHQPAMKTTVVIAVFMLNALLCVPQEPSIEKPVVKNQLLLSPLRLIDPVNPGLLIFYQRRISDRQSIELGAMPVFEIFPSVTDFKNCRGFRFSFEAKRHFGDKKRLYWSCEAVAQSMRYKLLGVLCERIQVDSLGYSETGEVEARETFSVKRNMFMLNSKLGVFIPLNRFVIDISFGLGVKLKDIRHYNRVLDGLKPKCLATGGEYIPSWDASREGQRYTLSLPLKMAVGYSF